MFQLLAPHPSLAHLVRSYRVLDDVHTELTAEHRLYPELAALLVFLHGESYLGVGHELRRLPPFYLQACRGLPLRLRSCGRTCLVAVELYPWGAIRLFGPLRSEGAFPCIVPAQISSAFAGRMQRSLVAGQLAEALQMLEQWLLTRAAQVGLETTPAVAAAIGLVQRRGFGTVAALAEGVGLSVRQLERQFRIQVGMSPKALARLSRFEAAQRHYLFHAKPRSFTRLAHDLGYADQAHFSREFRDFAGLSPGGFVAETREFMRRRGDVAFVQAEPSLLL